jgi:hypothetical protein
MTMRTYAPRGYYPGRPLGGTRVTTTPRRQATEKQLIFLGTLHADRQFDAKLEASYVTVVNVNETHGSVPMNVVSDLIDRAKASPWKSRQTTTTEAPAVEFSEGLWIIGEDIATARIFKVQRAVHGSGNLYGKELVDGRFEYFQGARRLLTSEGRKLTLEEAKQYGALYGTCCICARTLTNEVSIEAGIGPVCAGRL